MSFNSLEFWVFLVLVLGLASALRRFTRVRLLFLTAASFFFYWASNRWLTLLIILATLFDFFAALRIEAAQSPRVRRMWFVGSVASNLTILGVFKYANFFGASLVRLGGALGVHFSIPTLDIILPVGISFYTFEAISYVADVYSGRFSPRRLWQEFNYFIVFFPKLTAGPIIRPRNFFAHLDRDEGLSAEELDRYVTMIFAGIVQKTVIADTMAPIVDRLYGATGSTDAFTTLIGLYAFALQIYFDFAGYSNIAIGIAGLLGIRLPENFRRPYIASSLTDFWKRWHLSLTSWFRDYFYFPLSLSDTFRGHWIATLLVTFLITGLWHGASWTFVLWGGLNGLVLCAERLLNVEPRVGEIVGKGKARRIGWSLVTFNLFAALWIPFRASSFHQMKQIASNIVSLTGPAAVRVTDLTVFGLVVATIALCVLDEQWDFIATASTISPWVKAPVFAMCALLAIAFSARGAQPFIYFRF